VCLGELGGVVIWGRFLWLVCGMGRWELSGSLDRYVFHRAATKTTLVLDPNIAWQRQSTARAVGHESSAP